MFGKHNWIIIEETYIWTREHDETLRLCEEQDVLDYDHLANSSFSG